MLFIVRLQIKKNVHVCMYHVYLIWASELTSWFFLTFGFVLGGTYS